VKIGRNYIILQEGIENVELEILDAVNIIEKYKENYFKGRNT